MPFFTGRTGSLGISTTAATDAAAPPAPAAGTILPVAKIRDWNLDTNVELISTNSIDSSFNTFTPGVKGATGSATLIYYRLTDAESTAGTTTSFVSLLNKIMKTGSIEATDRLFFDLNVGADGAGNVSINDIKFWGYITSASVSVSTGELSVVPIQFTMDGDFVEVIS